MDAHAAPCHMHATATDASPHHHSPFLFETQAVEKATELFDKYAKTHSDGRLTLPELQQLMEEASQQFPHLREHATFLDG